MTVRATAPPVVPTIVVRSRSKSDADDSPRRSPRSRSRTLSSASSAYTSSAWSNADTNETLRRLRCNEAASVAFDDQFSGWLWMRGTKFGRWRHRYFCLSGSVLSYFLTFPSEEFLRQASPESVFFRDGTAPRGVLRVAHVQESESKTLGFRIFGSCGRVIEIRAHRVEERNEWLRALKTPARRKSRSWSTGSSDDRTLSLASFDPENWTCTVDPRQSIAVTKSGWLLKRSDVLKRWNRYFFVLQGTTLSYYANDAPYAVPRRRGYVTGVSVSRTSVGANGFHPELDIKLANQSELRVRLGSEDELDEWRDLLLDCTVATSPSLSSPSLLSLLPLL